MSSPWATLRDELSGAVTTDSCPPALPPLRVRSGAVIKHYEVIRLLGRGGMGEVHLARDTRLGRLVALKFLSETTPERAGRFVVEARATAQLAHESIVSLYDIDEHEGLPYMVLEYVSGRSLRELLKARAERLRDEAESEEALPRVPLSPLRAVELMLPVVRALVRAHEAGIVHRDLKPANIMIADSGAVKVLDFGIAKLLRDEGGEARRETKSVREVEVAPADPWLTRDGAVLGTMAFMAPEQWNVEGIDHRVDLWAVGIMLYEMVVGAHPLAPVTLTALTAVIDFTTPMPSAREARPELGKLGSIIDACLLKRREDRMGSARELLRELEALLPSGRPSRGDDACPYTGLSAFQESDADRFFGRERAVLQAVTRLGDTPLLAVVGPSGAGKSSFMRAGVIPALKRGGEAWEAFVVRPGPHPLSALSELLLQSSWQSATRDEGEAEPSPVEAIALPEGGERGALSARLAREPGYLGAVLRARARRKRERIALVVDQLEEAFTLVGAEEREAFFRCLSGAADDAGSPLRVLVSLRADFLDRIATTQTRLLDLVGQGIVLLQPLDREGLKKVLVQPAEASELHFESEALVEEMLDALVGTAGALPLLQFTASKLWEARDVSRRLFTEESYRRLGGVAGALASHADLVLDGMTQAEKDAARALLLRLVTPERTRALVPLAELRALGEVAGADMSRVLGRLIDARLLTVGGGGAEAGLVELVHESLMESWPTLHRWLEENEGDAAFMARLSSAALDWERSGHAEGLVWRGEAAEDAARWEARHRLEGRGALAPREAAYLGAVRALRQRARRMRQSAVGVVIAALVLVAGSTSYMAWKREIANRAAEAAARAANAASLLASVQAARARDAARMAALMKYPKDATTRLALLREVESPTLPPRWMSEVRMALATPLARAIFEGHGDSVVSVAWSPDGHRIASVQRGGLLRVWSADGKDEPHVLMGAQAGQSALAAWSPDGHRLAFGGPDNAVHIYDVDGQREQVAFRGNDRRVSSVAWSPDGLHVASSSEDETVRVFCVDGSGDPLVLKGHTGGVNSVAYSPDGRHLASGSDDATVRVWSAEGRGDPLVLKGHARSVNSVAWSPDGKRIASASDDATVRLWRSDGLGSPRLLEGHQGVVDAVAFCPEGSRIASAGEDATVRVWPVSGGGETRIFTGHSAWTTALAFRPDGRALVSGSIDKTLRVWDLEAKALEASLTGSSGRMNTVAVSPDGALVASGGTDHRIRLWGVDGSSRVLIDHPSWVLSVAFLSEGARLASVGDVDGAIRIWDTREGKLLHRLLPTSGEEAILPAVAAHPDGSRVAVGGVDAKVRIYPVDGASAPLVLSGHTGWVRSLSWHPDGGRLASSASDGMVRVWDTGGEGASLLLQGHEGPVWSIAYSHDGSRLASGGADRTLRIWRPGSGAPPLVLRGQADELRGVAWTKDDARIVTASLDGIVRLWNSDGSGEPMVIGAHDGAANAVAIYPDGRRVISGGDDGLRVWDDFTALSPSSPRLWRATSYCMPAAVREAMLGLTSEAAAVEEQACRRRVLEAEGGGER